MHCSAVLQNKLCDVLFVPLGGGEILTLYCNAFHHLALRCADYHWWCCVLHCINDIALCIVHRISYRVVGQETITEKPAACGIRGDGVPCHPGHLRHLHPCHLGHLRHLHHRLDYRDSHSYVGISWSASEKNFSDWCKREREIFTQYTLTNSKHWWKCHSQVPIGTQCSLENMRLEQQSLVWKENLIWHEQKVFLMKRRPSLKSTIERSSLFILGPISGDEML